MQNILIANTTFRRWSAQQLGDFKMVTIGVSASDYTLESLDEQGRIIFAYCNKIASDSPIQYSGVLISLCFTDKVNVQFYMGNRWQAYKEVWYRQKWSTVEYGEWCKFTIV